jgi:hypothetical protein
VLELHRAAESHLGTKPLSSTDNTTHAAPADQPTSVHQITDRLFPAYIIDGGSVHLAGCWLEDRVFLRLEFRRDGEPAEIFVDQQGRPVEAGQIEALGMGQTIRLASPPQWRKPEISKALECGRRLAEAGLPGEGPPELAGLTVLWCKYVRGKLRFVIGEHTTELAFSGWARLVEPPPFVCPHCGRQTYHLAATDDGRILAADEIGVCEQTGRRLPADELVICAATGRRVGADLVATCPVSGDCVLTSEMTRCGMCRELVSPAAIERSRCGACRGLEPVDKSDPRLERLLHEHPQLAGWGKWQLSETAAVYILASSGWLKRLLAVFDKETLALRLLATGSRLTSNWQAVEPADYPRVLGG